MWENELVWLVIILALALILPAIKRYAFKQSGWIGTITNKEHKPEREELTTDSEGHTSMETFPEEYILFFQTNAGKKGKLDVSADEYEQLEVGDAVQKQKGNKHLLKVPSSNP